MAAASGLYGLTIEKMMIDTVGLSIESETAVKVRLAQAAYTPNFDTHDFRNDATNEPGNSGTYAAGGSVVTATEVTVVDPAATQLSFDAIDVAWTAATITAAAAIGYFVRGGADTADELIWSSSFGGDVATVAGTFTVSWHATNKIFYVDYA